MANRKTPKPKIDHHKDILSRDITIDSYVAAPYQNSMLVAKVVALTPKMVKLSKLNITYKNIFTRYAWECVLLDPNDVTYYILRNSE